MEWVLDLGYIGLFLITFLAATVFPLGSDPFMIAILLGGGDPFLSFVSATAGNWMGGLTTYWLGRLGKWEYLEKWFNVSEETLERQRHKVDRFGPLLALVCWAPFVGDVFAIALGFYRLDFLKCAVYMLIGKGLRFGLWVGLYLAYGRQFLDFLNHFWL